MKARHLFIPVLLLILAACEPVELENEYQRTLVEGKNSADSVYTLTVQAFKNVDTKALDLVNGDQTLNTYWKNGEKVQVFINGNGYGLLDVICGDGKPKTATLSGTITYNGLKVGDVLTLLIPSRNDAKWDYTGQNGVLTEVAGSIEKMFDYATAILTIESIEGTKVTTTGPATFRNEQSIYRFAFTNATTSSAVNVKKFTIYSSNNKISNSLSFNGTNKQWESMFGSLTVTASSSTDKPLYVALRYGDYTDNTTARVDDNFSFDVFDNNDALYLGGKAVPADKLVYGKYLNTTIQVSQVKLNPNEATPATSVW